LQRKKSGLESLLSFNRFRKRWGARKFAQAVEDYEAMKRDLVEDSPVPHKSGKKRSLDEHMANLRLEFKGQPEILFHHAKLIVLLRREFDVGNTYRQFQDLWQQEVEFLTAHLDLRWLISACDTFADHDDDGSVRAIAMMASLFGNTIKIYETDRFISERADAGAKTERIEQLQTSRVQCFDGVYLLKVGSDDTLRNMHWRLKPFFQSGVIGKIAQTIYDRMQQYDTAYGRMRALHHHDRSKWW
jgi:hypothetical protein